MFTHKLIQRSLLTAFVLSTTSLASAHVFRTPPSKAEAAAECKKAVNAPTAKRAHARFGPPSAVTTGLGYRVAGPQRFGSEPRVAVVACTMPMRSHVACL